MTTRRPSPFLSLLLSPSSSLCLLLAAATTLLAGGCTQAYPPQLWLAPNGSERAVRLVPHQPVPF